jgi:hypothetical protein
MEKIIYDRIIDRAWRERYLKALKGNDDLLFESFEPQNGKTLLIFLSAWIMKYVHGYRPVVILDNSLTDLRQMRSRLDLFNHELKDESLILSEVKTNTRDVDPDHGLITTLQAERYDRLVKLLNDKDKVVIIYDEADHSVGSALDETDKKKELYWRLLAERLNIKFIYVTATGFAVTVARIRQEMKKNLLILPVPERMYTDYEYRGFYHSRHILHLMDGVASLSGDSKKIDRASEEELKCFFADLACPISSSQPNIALINVAWKNAQKYDLSRYFRDRFNFKGHIIIYSGEGVHHLSPDGKSLPELSRSPDEKRPSPGRGRDRVPSRSSFDREGTYFSTYIGEFLDRLKASWRKLKNDKGNNILILATRKAQRSQTYKTTDGYWKITHFLLYLSPKASVETVIQSLRCNGQYHYDDPPTHLYMSPFTHCQINYALYNKRFLHANIRRWGYERAIRETAFVVHPHIPLVWSRPEINIFVCRADRYYDGEFESEKDMRFILGDEKINIVTTRVEIPLNDLLQDFPELEDRYRDPEGDPERDRKIPLEGLPPRDQRRLGKWVKQILKEHDLPASTIQIAGYGIERENRHNRLLQEKPKQYQCQVIAFSATRHDPIPIIHYKTMSESPSEDSNIITAWHTTTGKIRIRFPREEINYYYAQMQQRGK